MVLTAKKIGVVIVWQNKMVMVFDKTAQPIAEYQGPYEQVFEKIMTDINSETKFFSGLWKTQEIKKISIVDFLNLQHELNDSILEKEVLKDN